MSKIDELRKVHAVQGTTGNWDWNHYMMGLYNGLELALSIYEDRDPVYKEAPKRWGEDKHNDDKSWRDRLHLGWSKK